MPDESRIRAQSAVIAIVVLLALGAVFALFVRDRTDPAQRPDENAWPGGGFHPEEYNRRRAADPLALGSPDAPVVMIEYVDLRCSPCGAFVRETETELIEKYVDTGILRIEWRNAPAPGEDSMNLARAAWAAGQQGRFRQFRALVHARAADTLSEDGLKKLAAKAGVRDPERFSIDFHARLADVAILEDQTEAEEIGIPSTPYFLINGQPVKGIHPLDTFTEAIDKAL
ncbi:DsbA family protein [Streptomyces clavuligerus]|uniref:DsbA family protein n=1 Tax=Streptomyces clavuligerus TaxID=1901 RepID=UPI0001851EC1|nr:thioredoxin domain-containing protein [Streptomyces clavuligerus]WDN56079.1 DsbA family protein [Streptomyces clavuligerus]